MTQEELALLRQYIKEKHAVVAGARVKYIDSSYDFIIKGYFCVLLRGFGWEEKFHVGSLSLERKLFQTIKDYLDKKANGEHRYADIGG